MSKKCPYCGAPGGGPRWHPLGGCFQYVQEQNKRLREQFLHIKALMELDGAQGSAHYLGVLNVLGEGKRSD